MYNIKMSYKCESYEKAFMCITSWQIGYHAVTALWFAVKEICKKI